MVGAYRLGAARACCMLAALLGGVGTVGAGAATPSMPPGAKGILALANQTSLGDLDEIQRNGRLRVLVVPNKTHYLVDKGRQYGLAYDMAQLFERDLATGEPGKKAPPRNARGHQRVRVVMVPVRRDQLFQRLQEGRGDIAIANLTVTEERKQWADFSVPFIDNVREVIVAGKHAAPLSSLESLSGRRIVVRRTSSFWGHLQTFNQHLIARGMVPVHIVAADEHMEAEDLLEMLNAGLIDYTVIDDHIGAFWAQIFHNIHMYPDLAIATDQQVAWAVRRNAPQLLRRVNAFLAQNHRGTLNGNTLIQRYLKNVSWIKTATQQAELRRFNDTIAIFRRYSQQYAFDHLLLTAQGFQESGLNQQLRSRVGAVGIMQLLPTTGASLRVGDIRQTEPNIHGGAKYMRQIADTYFNQSGVDAFNQSLFAFAAYNAGPNRITRMREAAAQAGLDPNVWFHNVEVVVAQHVGQETVQYVGNITKYYIAYRMLAEQSTDGLNSENPSPSAP